MIRTKPEPKSLKDNCLGFIANHYFFFKAKIEEGKDSKTMVLPAELEQDIEAEHTKRIEQAQDIYSKISVRSDWGCYHL